MLDADIRLRLDRLNLDAVLGACERLPDLGITHRRTTVSTVGWVPGIRRLAECQMPLRLALSLHAPEDALRSELMPVNERFPLAEARQAHEALAARITEPLLSEVTGLVPQEWFGERGADAYVEYLLVRAPVVPEVIRL